MKLAVGEREVRLFNRFGIKPLVSRFILLKPINVVLLAFARRFLPITISSRLPLNRNYVEYRSSSGNTVRLCRPNRDIVARDIYWGGGRPTSAADALVLDIFDRLCREAQTFVDIGTYAGLFALVAARANEHIAVVAYDIVPENYLLALSNVLANDMVGRIDCHLLGMGAEPGTICVPPVLGLSSNALSVSLGSRFGHGIGIPITTLDQQAKNWKAPVLMKIDVEGFELEVLTGGSTLLAEHRPDIICEILPGNDEEIARLQDVLRRYDYHFFRPIRENLVEFDQITPTLAARDWLFTTDVDRMKRLSVV
ncbi:MULTISPECIES: FkbM family methyltransferase [unclassified Sphingomonas]|uniref:FkbM family methyltransferase n=1 Tax=unclassified Sphingomonas TaxID=196159 RepID=UPI00226B5630|nr:MULTISPECIES: FkbM family methyltransferase [unclassified Sphingomonas]